MLLLKHLTQISILLGFSHFLSFSRSHFFFSFAACVVSSFALFRDDWLDSTAVLGKHFFLRLALFFTHFLCSRRNESNPKEKQNRMVDEQWSKKVDIEKIQENSTTDRQYRTYCIIRIFGNEYYYIEQARSKNLSFYRDCFLWSLLHQSFVKNI